MPKLNLPKEIDKLPFSRYRKAIKLALTILGGILLMWAVFIAVSFYMANRENKKVQFVQEQTFAAVEKACQAKPVVVIYSHGSFWGGSHSYRAYLPASTKYESVKTLIIPTIVMTGYDRVDGYYCSLDAAQRVYKDKKLSVDPAQ